MPVLLARVVDVEEFALFTVGISHDLHMGATQLLLSVKDVQRMKKYISFGRLVTREEKARLCGRFEINLILADFCYQ